MRLNWTKKLGALFGFTIPIAGYVASVWSSPALAALPAARRDDSRAAPPTFANPFEAEGLDRFAAHRSHSSHSSHVSHSSHYSSSGGIYTPPDTTTTTPYSPPPVTYRGELQSMVMRAQLALQARGYDPGVIDGVLGDKTRTALRTYQQDSGLPASGRLDAKTLVSLGITAP